MKPLLITMMLAFALAGCGHTTTVRDTTPEMAHARRSDVGVFSTDVTSDTAEKSAYQLCLEKNAGYPGAAEECGYWIRAGRPGQLPQYQAGGYYPSYGNYGTPGYNRWSSPGRPYGY